MAERVTADRLILVNALKRWFYHDSPPSSAPDPPILWA